MGPVISYGRAFGNTNDCGGDQSAGWQFVCGEASPPPGGIPVPSWWRKLTGNTVFRRKLGERWNILRGDGGGLDTGAVNRFIEKESARLKTHGVVVRNERRWNVLLAGSSESKTNEQINAAYEMEIERLKDWFPERSAWMTSHLPSSENGYMLQGFSESSSGAMDVAGSAAVVVPLVIVGLLSVLM